MTIHLNPDIQKRFAFHAATTTERQNTHGYVRNALENVAHIVDGLLPRDQAVARERALVMTKLEEAMFWANAAVARAPEPKGEAL